MSKVWSIQSICRSFVSDDRGYDREVLTNLLFCSQNSTESHTSSTENPPGITVLRGHHLQRAKKAENANQEEGTENGEELMRTLSWRGTMRMDRLQSKTMTRLGKYLEEALINDIVNSGKS